MREIAIAKYIIAIMILAFLGLGVMCQRSVRMHQKLERASDKLALLTAFSVREMVEKNDECPKKPRDWEGAKLASNGSVELKVGWHRLIYRCSADLEFSIVVLYNFDAGTYISGGAQKEIHVSYGHDSAPKQVILNDPGQIEAVLGEIQNY